MNEYIKKLEQISSHTYEYDALCMWRTTWDHLWMDVIEYKTKTN